MGDLTASHEVTIKFHLQMLPPFSDLIESLRVSPAVLMIL